MSRPHSSHYRYSRPSSAIDTKVSYDVTDRKAKWPVGLFYGWAITTLVSGVAVLGSVAFALETHTQLRMPYFWLFAYGVSAGSIITLAVLIIIILFAKQNLPPNLALLFACAIFALSLAGLVNTAIQLFGPSGSVSADCRNYVLNKPVNGPSTATMVWLQQKGLCNAWYVAFSFYLIGTLIQILMIVTAIQTGQAIVVVVHDGPEVSVSAGHSRSSLSYDYDDDHPSGHHSTRYSRHSRLSYHHP